MKEYWEGLVSLIGPSPKPALEYLVSPTCKNLSEKESASLELIAGNTNVTLQDIETWLITKNDYLGPHL